MKLFLTKLGTIYTKQIMKTCCILLPGESLKIIIIKFFAEKFKFSILEQPIFPVSVISSEPPCKHGNARYTKLPLKPYYDQNVDHTSIFLTRKCVIPIISSLLHISKKCASHVCRETAN